MVPLVGLTCYRQVAAWGAWERPAALLPVAYVDTVAQAGGRPLVVPPCEPGMDGAGEVVAAIDALVLVGGEDIGDDPLRDASELALLSAALDATLPVLAVCRGHQLLNVHLGGTLVPHLPDVLGNDAHRPARGQFAPMTIAVAAGSRVAQAMGERCTVSCSHHQGIADLGRGLLPTARSADGVIEAVEAEGEGFVVGVQWHPEEDRDTRLFAALVEAARESR